MPGRRWCPRHNLLYRTRRSSRNPSIPTRVLQSRRNNNKHHGPLDRAECPQWVENGHYERLRVESAGTKANLLR